MKRIIPRLVAVLVLLALAVVGVLYGVGYYESKPTPPGITYNGEAVTSLSGVGISRAQPLKLGVETECTIKILPAKDIALVYTVDGKEQAFSAVENFNEGFDMSLEEGVLTVSPVGNLEQVLEKVHAGADVVLPAIDYDLDLFTLSITGEDLQVSISFGLFLFDVTGVSLPGKVVF